MRRPQSFLLAALFLSLAFLGACSSSNDIGVFVPDTDVLGSGNIVSEQRSVSGFSSVMHNSEGQLTIVQGPAENLVIRADDNLLPYLETVVVGGELQLRTRSNVDIRPTRPIEFELTVTDVEELDLSGVGKITCLDVNRTSLDVYFSGVGEVRLAGTVTDQLALLSGVGDYQAGQLTSTNATIMLSGVGDATVWVSGVLDATVSGTGTVYYYGSPTTINDHGMGGVQPGL